MKSEKSKKILAFVLCMVLMLTTSMSTMAEGGLIGETSSESNDNGRDAGRRN